MATAAERRAARAKLKQQESLHKAAPVKEAAPPPEERAPSANRSRNTVTVGCKVPNGLILQNEIMVDDFEQVFGGGVRAIKKAQPDGPPIRINGPARAPGSDPDAKRVIGGYGLTYNVPRDDFERWINHNAALDIVRSNLIFACEDKDRAQDQARDQKSLRSGLEALNTESRGADGRYVDPRMPNKVKKFNPDDESTNIRGVA